MSHIDGVVIKELVTHPVHYRLRGTCEIFSKTRLHGIRILDPPREMLRVVRVDAAGDRRARRDVRQIRTRRRHHYRHAANRVTRNAHTCRDEILSVGGVAGGERIVVEAKACRQRRVWYRVRRHLVARERDEARLSHLRRWICRGSWHADTRGIRGRR